MTAPRRGRPVFKRDTNVYRYSYASITPAIYQALKDKTYGRITQQEAGLLIEQLGKKMRTLAPPPQPELPYEDS